MENISMSVKEDYGNSVRPLFKVVAPFMKYTGGYGYFGTLLQDENTKKIQCHMCGKWYRVLDGHIRAKHDTSSRDYKEEVGLNLGCGLQASDLTENNQRNGKEVYARNNLRFCNTNKFKKGENNKKPSQVRKASYQKRNRNSTCDAQLKYRFDEMWKELGRMPTSVEFRNKVHFRDYYETFNDMLDVFGYSPRVRIKKWTKGRWSKEKLLNVLKEFVKKYNREPMTYDTVKGLLPSSGNFIKYFGSFKDAKKEVGY